MKSGIIRKIKEMASGTDGFGGMPRIEMTGNREAVITGATGILVYGNGEIRLSTTVAPLAVTGRDIYISAFSEEYAIIKGFIGKVEFSF